MNISLHTLVLSGSFYLIYLIDIIKKRKYHNKKNILAAILMLGELLLTLLWTYPSKDCNFSGLKIGSLTTSIFKICHLISEATIGSNLPAVIEVLITIIFFVVVIYSLKNKKEKLITIAIIFIPLIALLTIPRIQPWHIGVLAIIISFLIITSKNSSKLLKIIMVFICIIQISWSVSSSIYDLKNNYSSSKEVANFLKANNYQNQSIYGLGYSVASIEPYFSQNIFKNFKTNKSFWIWSKKSPYMSNQDMLNNKAKIYIISLFYKNKFSDIIKILEDLEYKKYYFDGHTYIKNSIYEQESFIIYIAG